MGDGTAWGGYLACTEESSRVRFPDCPLITQRDNDAYCVAEKQIIIAFHSSVA